MGNCMNFLSTPLEESFSETSSLVSTSDAPGKTGFLRNRDIEGHTAAPRRPADKNTECLYQPEGCYRQKKIAKNNAANEQEVSDSGIHSRSSLTSPKKCNSNLSYNIESIISSRGKALFYEIKHAYKLKDRFSEPREEFLKEMDKLFMNVQLHLTDISGRTLVNQRESDSLVEELLALRNYWGRNLLPNSVCNAFVRERIHITVNNTRFRIDCAQFFEPVPFYTTPITSSGELMKLYRFSVYETNHNEVVMRYYLERSNVIQLYHVLCYSCGNERGQVCPYGINCPSYWVLRDNMLTDACLRLQYS